MSTAIESKKQVSTTVAIPLDVILGHWQGHRRLTRRVIEAFPEDKFFTYSIGGMRSFADLVMEMMGIAAPGINGILTGDWSSRKGLPEFFNESKPTTKAEVLRIWDAITDEINELGPQIKADRFHEVEAAFGKYEDTIYSSLQYFVDNEIHHRGQGYVYLRSLGIEPPAFYDRS